MFDIEVTDTIGGEANYSWVRRYSIDLPDNASQARVMRAAKRTADFSNVRGVTSALGDGFEFRPYGMAIVMFVTWREPTNGHD